MSARAETEVNPSEAKFSLMQELYLLTHRLERTGLLKKTDVDTMIGEDGNLHTILIPTDTTPLVEFSNPNPATAIINPVIHISISPALSDQDSLSAHAEVIDAEAISLERRLRFPVRDRQTSADSKSRLITSGSLKPDILIELISNRLNVLHNVRRVA